MTSKPKKLFLEMFFHEFLAMRSCETAESGVDFDQG